MTNSPGDYEEYVKSVIDRVTAPVPKAEGKAGFPNGLTMQIRPHLMGLKDIIESIVDADRIGDVWETGAWRGGTSIFMVAVFRAYEYLHRRTRSTRDFFVCDSFDGFVKSGDAKLDDYLDHPYYVAPLAHVKDSFKEFGLLDEHVHFVKGDFAITIPAARPLVAPIALLRLDGDLYNSTMVVLKNLHDLVVPRGWVVIDDYTWNPERTKGTLLCKDAVDEFRAAAQVDYPITTKFGRPAWQTDHRI